jgi:hypothetical protein
MSIAPSRPVRPVSAALAVALALPALAAFDAPGAGNEPGTPAVSAPDRRDATRPTRTEPLEQRSFSLSFRPRAEHTFDADLRDSNGSVAVSRAGATLGLAVPLGERTRLLINTDAEFSRYDFSDASDLLPSGRDPLDDAWMVRLSPGVVVGLDETWSITGGAIVEIAAESGADVSDAITYGGFFGARYRWSPTLTTTFGAIAKSRLEDDVIVVPLLGVEWQITDRVVLLNEGLGLKLRADLSEQWRAGVFARFELRDYRLADDGALPDGVLRDQRVPLGLSIEWRPSPSVQVELSGGAVVYQKYTFDDSNGNKVESDRTRPAPFIGLTATFAF